MLDNGLLSSIANFSPSSAIPQGSQKIQVVGLAEVALSKRLLVSYCLWKSYRVKGDAKPEMARQLPGRC